MAACGGNEPIALVASACRFPGGASGPSKLWQLLSNPRDVLQPLNERFDTGKFHHNNGKYHGSTNVKSAYLLAEDHRVFDASFFSITPREAEAIDPQQRILLEAVYEALENGGFAIEKLQGSKTSVYAGVMTADYYDVQVRDVNSLPEYTATGTARSIISNRISYFFDWKGPSITIDTACSSSLVAVHLAVQSLRSGESNCSVVAGSNVILGPEMFIMESKLSMLSSAGRSRMWDADANGYARGEGAAALVFKRLSDAVRDGDHIACIIRETGVNQDGRTRGITMPSATAQAALIRETYAKAGLDPCRPEDRCQYFEAHGTGTPAGDPIEAEAIHSAFFPRDNTITKNSRNRDNVTSQGDAMYVGSIKTVIGHLEGGAGVAGLLKVSLALQNGIIPPNLMFNSLNPALKPYNDNLKVPTNAKEWPAIPSPVRRASVNSFGFGGTNAHAIVESFHPQTHCPSANIFSNSISQSKELSNAVSMAGPMVFSANSETSLRRGIESFSSYLKSRDSVSLRDLAWTLQSRRTQLPIKVSFSAATREKLVSAIDAAVESAKNNPEKSLGIRSRSSSDSPIILGVFTGQGAQWPTMGKELILNCSTFQKAIASLEQALKASPDPPTWSLMEELLADSSSRLGEAAIAQPLCTAVQVGLVDLYRSAGIRFGAVVGHSSGEIGAAYAAGVLSAADAIRVAYYRGKYAKLAGNSNGQPGAMMAVGLSQHEASDFCKQPQFCGRIVVAASNSPTSVTLSGDKDAIDEAKAIFDERKTFARLLKVDTAYHSHHMNPCAGNYVRAMRSCGIQIHEPDENCSWYSSVHGSQKIELRDELKDVYWKDNMVNAVLFSHAIEHALGDKGRFDFCIEVGPHAALKGPVTQTIKQLTGKVPPYFGLLSRGDNDVVAFSSALGSVWAQLGASSVDFDGYRVAFEGTDANRPKLLVDLPSYSWDHIQVLWHESQLSKNFRHASHRHELLGTLSPDRTEHELRWRNVIRLDEQPWLYGHKFQGQVLYPAAGYIAMALQSSVALAAGRTPSLIELQDIEIFRGMPIDEGSSVETLFTLKNLGDSINDVRALFTCYSCGDKATKWEKNFSGTVRLHFNDSATGGLPRRMPTKAVFNAIDIDRFYASMKEIGLDYTGAFRALTSLERRLNMSTASLSREAIADSPMDALVHPALLDVTFQTLFGAFCAPGDGSLWTPFLPTRVKCLRINPAGNPDRLSPATTIATSVSVDSYVTESSASLIAGDLDVYVADEPLWIQIEGLAAAAVSKPQPSNDKKLFASMEWDVDVSSLPHELNISGPDPSDELESVELGDRLSYYFFRNLRDNVPRADVAKLDWHYQRLFEYMDRLFSTVGSGKHPMVRREWDNDTLEDLMERAKKFPGLVDLEIVAAVGKNLPAAVRHETILLDVMMKDDMLNRLYKYGIGFPRINPVLANIAASLSHRYPNMKILEIGAGTGGTSKYVLENLKAFSSYTYTDISAGFFGKAQEMFKDHISKLKFMTLDIEKDVLEQGYSEQSFDLIIASNVLHATASLSRTMNNVRRLLKPGGRLLLLEITNDILRATLVMGGLPGWWLGGDDNRRLNPTISPERWDKVLRETGFSGIDTISNDYADPVRYLCSVMVTQAVDDRVNLLRQPLASADFLPRMERLVVIGGATRPVSRLVNSVLDHLKIATDTGREIIRFESFEDLDKKGLQPGSTFLCLGDLDEPLFKARTEQKHKSVQSVFGHAKHILWLTSGAVAKDPFANMSVGLCRTLALEYPHIRLQLLDLDSKDHVYLQSKLVAELLLRLLMPDVPGFTDDLLWTIEAELSLKKGMLHIPRVMPNKYLNDRMNAARRPIMNNVFLENTPVEVVYSGLSPVLRELKLRPRPQSDQVRIRVSHSTIFAAYAVDDTALHVSYGKVVDVGAEVSVARPGDQVIALSSVNGSQIDVAMHQVHTVRDLKIPADQFVLAVHSNIVANHLLASVPSGGTVVLHEPIEVICSALCLKAERSGVHIVRTTSRATTSPPSLETFIHPHSSKRTIRAILPQNVNLFVNFAGSGDADFGTRIKACLPSPCRVMSASTLFSASARLSPITAAGQLREALVTATWSPSITEPTTTHSEMNVELPPQEVIKCTMATDSTSIINWNLSSKVAVTVEPITVDRLFDSAKTYFLVGCTGGLGQSLCRWMAQRGARYFALTSRSPFKGNVQWLDELRDLGATVRIFQADLADKGLLASVYDEIVRTMPPIAGVANAAMVLEDTLFVDMSFETMEKGLRPKVDISRNLDELFTNKIPLDFFILFSSLTYVCGNIGQCNYTVANSYMVSLAAQRRANGLAGSVIDIGLVLGLGYIVQTGGVYENILKRENFAPISEGEVHHMIAEAILTGGPESTQPSEIITGLQHLMVNSHEGKLPSWFGNPRLSHFVVEDSSSLDQASSGDDASSVPLKQQLAEASSRAEAVLVLQGRFATSLSVILQVSTESIDGSTRLIELGIDSLVAVEIRTWFLKEINVDVPILRVLGGASVSELCEEALGKLDLEASTEDKAKSTRPPVSKPAAAITGIPSSSLGGTPSVSIMDDGSSIASAGTPATIPSPPEGELAASDKFVKIENMSYAQSRIYFLSILSEDPTTYNVTLTYHIKGPLRVEGLQKAFRDAGMRHESMRTCFFVDPETSEPKQGVLKSHQFRMEHRMVANEIETQQEIEQFKHHEYDLEAGKTVKVALLSRSEHSHTLIFGHHHIVLDGISGQVLLRDLDKSYRDQAFLPVVQYTDFAVGQRQMVESGGVGREVAFWKQQFQDLPPVLPILPFSRVSERQELYKYGSRVLSLKLNSSLNGKIKEIGRQLRTTSFHLHLSVLQVLMFTLTRTEDVCIGVLDANRSDETMNSAGFFVNLLPVRFQVRPATKFADLAVNTRQAALQAIAHSKLPFDILLSELAVPRSTTYSPLFQVVMNYRMGSFKKGNLGDCEAEFLSIDDAQTGYDLTVDVEDTPDGTCHLSFIGQEYLYSHEDMRNVANAYVELLQIVSSDPFRTVNECRISGELPPGIGESSLTTLLPKSQRAVVSARPGKLEVREGVLIPRVETDMILVKNVAVALNPVDWRQADYFSIAGGVFGMDFAGTVASVGSSVTKALRVGDRVCGWTFGSNPLRPEIGSFAEYVGVNGDLVMKIPATMSFEEAATLGLGVAAAGQALYQSLGLPIPSKQAATTSKSYVLVYGGSTATGTLAIQLIRLSGLIPITTCSPHNFALVESLGAEAAFNYRSPSCAADIREYTKDSLGYVLDCVCNSTTMEISYAAIGSSGGRYTSLDPYPARKHTRKDVKPDWILAFTQFGQAVKLGGVYNRDPKPEDHEFMVRWFETIEELIHDGKLTPHPAEVNQGGLGQVIDRLERLKKGKVSGKKIVVQL